MPLVCASEQGLPGDVTGGELGCPLGHSPRGAGVVRGSSLGWPEPVLAFRVTARLGGQGMALSSEELCCSHCPHAPGPGFAFPAVLAAALPPLLPSILSSVSRNLPEPL